MLSEEVPHLQASFDPTVVFGGVTQYIVWMVICWIITPVSYTHLTLPTKA